MPRKWYWVRRVAPLGFKNMNHKNCAIYTRVSTDNQAEKEFSSCEAQEQKIRSFIASQADWQVFKIYNDAGFSGAILQRPALQELLADLKKEKIDVVLVYKIDRLTRSPKDFYQLIEFFEQAKIDFISITERFDTSTPAGRLLRNIMLTFSQFERELTSERTRDKMLERARKGLCNGGFTPYGYSRQDKKLVVNPKEAEEIKSIFETYIETGSLAETYKALKKQEVKSKFGKNFSKTIIAYLLRNPVYIGKIKHNNQIYNGIHEAIISEEIFALAQKIHKEKQKNFRVYKNFLFGGLIKCEGCGSNMSSSFSNKHSNGKFDRRYYYYRCTSTTKFDWESCSVKQVSAERLENFCLENLERILVDKSYIENLVFRLNHSSDAGYQNGHEPTDSSSKFSTESISDTLKFFLAGLKTTKGIERNLFTKRFLSNIFYSPESIKIRFNLGQSGGEAAAKARSAPPKAGLVERTLSSPNSEFVPFNSADHRRQH